MFLLAVLTLPDHLVISATLNRFSFVHRSSLADNYYGMYDHQSVFTLDLGFHYDPSELELGV